MSLVLISFDKGMLAGWDFEKTPPNMPLLDYFQLMAIEKRQKQEELLCLPHHLPKSVAKISLVQAAPLLCQGRTVTLITSNGEESSFNPHLPLILPIHILVTFPQLISPRSPHPLSFVQLLLPNLLLFVKMVYKLLSLPSPRVSSFLGHPYILTK